MIEMRAHQTLEPRHEERKLHLVAMDEAKPPVGDGLVIAIDHVVPERVPDSDQGADRPDHRILSLSAELPACRTFGRSASE
jgi:hypothetical protein